MLESQKQALIEQQTKISQIPPLLPPGVDTQPIQSKVSGQSNQKFANNSMNNGNTISSNSQQQPLQQHNIGINRQAPQPNVPPPLMSQNVALPLMSIPTVKPSFCNNSNNSNENISNFQVNFRLSLSMLI